MDKSMKERQMSTVAESEKVFIYPGIVRHFP